MGLKPWNVHSTHAGLPSLRASSAPHAWCLYENRRFSDLPGYTKALWYLNINALRHCLGGLSLLSFMFFSKMAKALKSFLTVLTYVMTSSCSCQVHLHGILWMTQGACLLAGSQRLPVTFRVESGPRPLWPELQLRPQSHGRLSFPRREEAAQWSWKLWVWWSGKFPEEIRDGRSPRSPELALFSLNILFPALGGKWPPCSALCLDFVISLLEPTVMASVLGTSSLNSLGSLQGLVSLHWTRAPVCQAETVCRFQQSLKAGADWG